MLYASLTLTGKHPRAHEDLSLEEWAQICAVQEMHSEAQALAIGKALEPLILAMFKGTAAGKKGRR